MNKFSILSIFIISFSFIYQSCAQTENGSAGYNSFVPPPSIDISEYPWLSPEMNMVQFYDRAALERFHKAWTNTDLDVFSVVLLGDSHLQTGPYPEQLSERLRNELEDGGIGLIFPNSTVKMYSPTLYTSKHTGEWERARSVTMRPKKDMGVRGFTASTTTLPAGFSFNFGKDIPSDQNRIKIYCKNTPNSYDLVITAGGQKTEVAIDGSNNLPYVEVTLPSIPYRSLSFDLVKNNPNETEFEVYGIVVESNQQLGAILHNAGVGAARYNSILYQSRFSEELPHFRPDLVVVDFGTNDYLYEDKILPELESEIRKVINKVKTAAPDASIILTTVQDLYWKDRNCKSAIPFAEMIHRIAKETQCGVYDWFWVSGGQTSLKKWYEAELARKDMIHLTIPGYKLKGNLFFDAMKNTVNWMSQNHNATELLLSYEGVKAKTPPIPTPTPTPTPTNNDSSKTTSEKTNTTTASTSSTSSKSSSSSTSSTSSKKKITHKISSGETLSSIASKHKVKVSDLMKWNDMKSDKIYAGKTLVIYK